MHCRFGAIYDQSQAHTGQLNISHLAVGMSTENDYKTIKFDPCTAKKENP